MFGEQCLVRGRQASEGLSAQIVCSEVLIAVCAEAPQDVIMMCDFLVIQVHPAHGRAEETIEDTLFAALREGGSLVLLPSHHGQALVRIEGGAAADDTRANEHALVPAKAMAKAGRTWECEHGLPR